MKDTTAVTKLEPLKIPEYQQKMINAFDTYLKYVPDAKETVTIMYRRARIFYEYNHFAEAAPLFQEIVDKHCDDDLAIYSANLLLDSLNALGKTKEVVENVDKFLDKQCLMKDPEFGKQMISAALGHVRHGGPRVREAAQLQGVRPLDDRRGRVAARAPQARRAPLERRPVLPERPPRRPGPQGAPAAHQGPREGSAGAEGALPRRGRLPPARVLLEGVGLLRGLRQEVPGREEGHRRARQRDDVPHRPRRGGPRAHRHEVVRRLLRQAQAAGRGRRVLPDGRRLRARPPQRRARQAPRELPQALGRAGRPRSPGARALQARRDGLEGLVPEGLRGRRLPRDQARHGDGPSEGPRRPQQEAQEGQEAAREAAHAVRPAHEVEDQPLRSQPRRRPPRPRSTSSPSSRSGTRARPPRRSRARTSRRARASRPTPSRARASTSPRSPTRTSSASSSPRASTSSSPRPTTRPRRRPPRRRRRRSRARSSRPTSTRRPRRSTRRARSTSTSSA